MNSVIEAKLILSRTSVFVFLLLSSGCSLIPGFSDQSGTYPYSGYGTTNYGGLQVQPSSTTVSVNQNLSFQASGGTPPYQFQLTNGVGSVDGYGNYQAGTYPGQAQIQVSDSAGNSGSASVSVVQSASSYGNGGYNYGGYGNGQTYNSQSQGWNYVSPVNLKSAPLVRGQIVGTDEHQLDDQGDRVQSKFLTTDLKHPLVRMDVWKNGPQTVAVRAVIEDQFLITLKPGYSEADLDTVVKTGGGHISRSLASDGSYLITLNKPGASLSAEFIAKRNQLKQSLQTVGIVSPNYVSVEQGL